MSRSLGPSLPPALLDRLSQREISSRLGLVLPLVTVDRAGSPHPMLLSYVEIRAYDPGTLGLVIQAQSTSARNLIERGTATLLVVEPDGVFYVKLRTVDGPLAVDAEGLGLGYFLLAVDEVLADAAAEWEAGLHITAATTYGPAPALDAPWVRATLAALATPRARA